LYQQVLSLLQDESFGLHLGKGVTPGAFRMMCYAIIHCENLGKAMGRACHFFSIFYERPFHLDLKIHGELASMGYPHSEKRLWNRYAQASDAYALSAWHRFSGWLIGRPIELDSVHFSGKTPDSQAKYTELFAAPVLFEQETSMFYFDKKYLDCPVVQTERSLKEFLRTAPYQLMVMDADTDSSSLVAQVKSLMGHDFTQGFPSFEKVAQALNMSAPTLRRRLKREGVTYQQLKDECRRDAAIAYLSRPELSINAVATLMGFTDPSAFHRSFKKWTGMPPGQFRARQFEGGGEEPEPADDI
jgi:AraC-like DNA-binding protein